jgi:hypothetical protein
MRPRVLEHRYGAEQQPRDQRDANGKRQHDRIERDLAQARQARRLEVDQQLDAAIRQRGAEDAADECDQQRLRHQLPRHLSRFGAKRETDGQLLLTRLGTHQEQVRDVRARNEEHESNGAEQNPQHGADVADHINVQRPHQRSKSRLIEHLLRETWRQRESLRQ